jgi:hypothetical protein
LVLVCSSREAITLLFVFFFEVFCSSHCHSLFICLGY